jgi:hypothetical protein
MHIYKTINLVNGKIYVGKSVSERISYLGSGTALGHAIKKYGRENFIKEIIEADITDKKVLAEREVWWIAQYRESNAEMYNIADGGEGGVGRKKGTPNPSKQRPVSIEGNIYEGVCKAADSLGMPYQTLCCRLNNQKNYAAWFYVDSPKEITEIGVYGKGAGPSISNIQQLECPHCKRKGKGNGFRRWHFEKCSKKLPI